MHSDFDDGYGGLFAPEPFSLERLYASLASGDWDGLNQEIDSMIDAVFIDREDIATLSGDEQRIPLVRVKSIMQGAKEAANYAEHIYPDKIEDIADCMGHIANEYKKMKNEGNSIDALSIIEKFYTNTAYDTADEKMLRVVSDIAFANSGHVPSNIENYAIIQLCNMALQKPQNLDFAQECICNAISQNQLLKDKAAEYFVNIAGELTQDSPKMKMIAEITIFMVRSKTAKEEQIFCYVDKVLTLSQKVLSITNASDEMHLAQDALLQALERHMQISTEKGFNTGGQIFVFSKILDSASVDGKVADKCAEIMAHALFHEKNAGRYEFAKKMFLRYAKEAEAILQKKLVDKQDTKFEKTSKLLLELYSNEFADKTKLTLAKKMMMRTECAGKFRQNNGVQKQIAGAMLCKN
ncbi:MAG: hypothetical protein WC492_02415 [Candidatus Micrarchaeia archaeon]